MNRFLFSFICLVFTTFSCQNNTPTENNTTETAPTTESAEQTAEVPETDLEPAPAMNDSIELPQGWVLIGETRGDLTKDGTAERVQVVEAETAAEYEAPERRLRIYRQEANAWSLWQEVAGGVLRADGGGAFGDPFEGVEIERGCIVLHHFGGSRIKWRYTHRYRWQYEAWQMIGTTILYGAPCDYWHNFDFNLSTGKVAAEIETEDCDQETSAKESFEFTHQVAPLPTLQNYEPGTTAVAVPGRDLTFYF